MLHSPNSTNREKKFGDIVEGDEVTLLVFNGRGPLGPLFRTRVGRAWRKHRKGWLVKLTRLGRPFLCDPDNFVEANSR